MIHKNNKINYTCLMVTSLKEVKTNGSDNNDIERQVFGKDLRDKWVSESHTSHTPT
jgi:IMP cyclohydrolase